MNISKTCPCCGGRGYINQFENIDSGCRAWAKECIACKGTGSTLYPETNADHIRAMSDEELAIEMCQRSISTICDIVCQGGCEAIATLNKTGNEACREIIMKWLQQPAEEET